MERTSEATRPWVDLGTWLSRLVMKWVRQRCQEAPIIVLSMAATRPLWASEMTSLTPVSPRSTRLRRKPSQAASSSEVKVARPRISR